MMILLQDDGVGVCLRSGSVGISWPPTSTCSKT